MSILERLFKTPKDFENTEVCDWEIRKTNKIIYKIWFIIMTSMNVSVILLSLYYITFVEGEAEIVGNYVYIGLYVLEIVISACFTKTFYSDALTMKQYNSHLSIFTYQCAVWILAVSCLDLYYTGSSTAFVGGMIDMTILYLKPKRFGYLLTGGFVIYCIWMIYLTLQGCYDEFGNFMLDNVTWVNLLNSLFNLGILTFTVVLFNHIKYGSKVSDVYKSTQLQELSNRDILTGLYNRMSLTHYIEDVNNSKDKNIVIAMLDIDDFKHINDTYGHTVGDKCIHLVGEEINKVTNKGYRYGGEEFLIIFENMEKSDVYNLMEGFRKEIETSETCGVKFTISIGISEYFKPANITDCIEQADSRLYVAKNTGKNKIVNVES